MTTPVVVCDVCGTAAALRLGSLGGRTTEGQARLNELTAAGWVLDGPSGRDVCPGCVTAGR